MKISEALGVSEVDLARHGVFDAYLGVDSQLHIDPSLLRSIQIPEFTGSLQRFESYFNEVLRLVVAAQPGGAIERQAINRLIFPENPVAGLGFSSKSTAGRGVTRSVAERLYKTAKELAAVGVVDPSIFEIAVLFEKKFGPDLISDMTLAVIIEDFSAYNARVCEALGIPTVQTRPKKFVAPFTTAYSVELGTPILLIPKALLADLPVASCRDDIDRVVAYNEKMRSTVHQILGPMWKNLAEKLRKDQLRQLLIGNPAGLLEILDSYKKHRPQPYDFERDPLGEILWAPLGKEAANAHPLALVAPNDQSELDDVVVKIIEQYKQLIELNGAWEFLYDEAGRQRHEKFSQLFFFAVADSYCEANNLDISREPNAGRGPVDFKLSRGRKARTLVELKLSSSSKYLDGFLKQLPEYGKSERVDSQVYVIVVISRNDIRVSNIEAEYRRLKSLQQPVPALWVINAYDAKTAPSASKLR